MKSWRIRLLVLFLLFVSACSPNGYNRLTVSSLNWIGYTPLFYAKSQGWLDEYNIDLIQVISLSENMYLFEAGNTDAFVGTQYEFGVLSGEMTDLLPIMMFDRSNGGDVVLGNMDIAQYRQAPLIDVYLEIDSVNQLVLTDFATMMGIDPQKFRLINADPVVVTLIDAGTLLNPTLIVAYNPYDIILQRQGFKQLASTADGLNLLVVDAMYTRRDTLLAHEEQFGALKAMVDRAMQTLSTDPLAVYEAIRPYLQDISFSEFTDSIQNVQWLNRDIDPALRNRLQDINFPTDHLLE